MKGKSSRETKGEFYFYSEEAVVRIRSLYKLFQKFWSGLMSTEAIIVKIDAKIQELVIWNTSHVSLYNGLIHHILYEHSSTKKVHKRRVPPLIIVERKMR